MMMIMFSKHKLILQKNQQIVCGKRKFTFSSSIIVISHYILVMEVRRKVQQMLK